MEDACRHSIYCSLVCFLQQIKYLSLYEGRVKNFHLMCFCYEAGIASSFPPLPHPPLHPLINLVPSQEENYIIGLQFRLNCIINTTENKPRDVLKENSKQQIRLRPFLPTANQNTRRLYLWPNNCWTFRVNRDFGYNLTMYTRSKLFVHRTRQAGPSAFKRDTSTQNSSYIRV